MTSRSRTLVADLETDGLLPELTTIHCLVYQDTETGEMVTCDPRDSTPSIEEGIEALRAADRVYFHNGIQFDIPAIAKVYGEEAAQDIDCLDTLLLAQARFAHIKDIDFGIYNKGKLPGTYIGRHTLEAWGRRLNCWKGNYDGGWEEWDPAMSDYCEQDVVVTQRLVEHLQKYGLPQEAVRIEHRLAKYLMQQEQNGWPFDLPGAGKLQAKLADRREEIKERLVTEIDPLAKSNGSNTPSQSRTMRKNFDVPQHYIHVPRDEAPVVEYTDTNGDQAVGKLRGQYTRLKYEAFNPGSRKDIYTVLMERYDWTPTVFTPNSGEPKVSEEILAGLEETIPIAGDLKEYMVIQKILGYVAEGNQAWIKHATTNEHTGEPHIHHACYQKPRTHRQAHSSPNLAQVPSNDAPYGEECRSLFRAPEGWTMFGTDASGLELRTVAHYTDRWDEGAFAEIVLEKDPHMATHDAVAAAIQENMKVRSMDHYSRGAAKGTGYAYLYGAGDTTLGKTVVPAGTPSDVAEKAGSIARGAIEDRFQALGRLRETVESKVRKGGYIRLIDGRRAFPANNYSSLNTLIQGTGAIICKAWVLEMEELLSSEFGAPVPYWEPVWKHPDAMWAGLGFIHDEVQMAFRTQEAAERAGELSVQAIKQVEKRYDLNVRLDADFDIGKTWRSTH